MPVSHLGLTVSHIPSATSFYLSALQPLGYRYIGQQGDAVGLGVTEADFFLCREQNGGKPSPTHVAFAADNDRTVRLCYTAALNAGGTLSVMPGKRNGDCACFNAAVIDLDGNTVEFIHREPMTAQSNAPEQARHSVQSWQQDVARSAAHDDTQSMASKTKRAKSRMQTALDIASTASKSMKGSTASAPSISRSRTEPLTLRSDNGGKAFVGTLLGAAAGAAFAYAMVSSERESAREEEAFAASTRSKAPSMRDVRSKSNYEGSVTSKKSSRSSRQPDRSTRAIEAPKYEDEDEIQDVLSSFTISRRPQPQRSNTYDISEYAPRTSTSHRSDRFSTKRSSTLPIDLPQQYLLEGPRTTPASRHTSRRGSFDDSRLKRHDSGVSMHSSRSRRSFESGRRSSFSKASTIKPPKGSLYESAAGVPLPSSKAPSYITAADLALPTSRAASYITAAELPLPASKAASYISAAQVSLPPSRTRANYSDAEESDGMSDMRTVVPEDSISCVDFSGRSRKSKGKSKSSGHGGSHSGSKASRHGSGHSEAPSERTVRPVKPTGSRHSAQTLPVRSKEDRYSSSGNRSTATYM